ncbi:MAG TPA: FAD-dependent oxidoreductase, partial [Chloroflexia bacterium]|nr:FAD-dependent oxidoreductase [Chloroflexia bacterium]
MKRLGFDVLVVGAGPAGMAAALSAAENGVRAGLVDDNPAPGGQIWRGASQAADAPGAPWLVRL